MKFHVSRLCASVLLTVLLLPSVFAQKVKVGYDKGADFTRYATYTWAEPGVPPTRPLLYAAVVGAIDYELKSKGLERTQNDGDLVLIPAGGIDFGFSGAAGTPILPTYNQTLAIDATMWTGAGGSSGGSLATLVPEGTLMLSFVDRRTNKVIWSGSVKGKLDIERKQKSLERINKAVVKLLKEFPPAKK